MYYFNVVPLKWLIYYQSIFFSLTCSSSNTKFNFHQEYGCMIDLFLITNEYIDICTYISHSDCASFRIIFSLVSTSGWYRFIHIYFKPQNSWTIFLDITLLQIFLNLGKHQIFTLQCNVYKIIYGCLTLKMCWHLKK